MEFETKKVGSVFIVKPLAEEINASSVTGFKSSLLTLVSKNKLSTILDLSLVSKMDSSAVGAIVNIGLKVLSFPKREFVIANAQNAILDILTQIHVNNLFSIYNSVEEGIEALCLKEHPQTSLIYLGSHKDTFELFLANTPPSITLSHYESEKSIPKDSKTNYIGIFIEEELLSQELVKGLRSRKNFASATFIGILSRSISIEEKKLVKEQFGVEIALDPPYSAEKYKALINQLEASAIKQPLASDKKPLSAQLLQNYRQTIPQKLKAIESLILECKSHLTAPQFEALKNALHKMSGSAGSYGFVKAGDSCKKATQLLDKALEEHHFTIQLCEEIEAIFNEIVFFFDIHLSDRSLDAIIPIRSLKRAELFAASSDSNFSSILGVAIERSGMQTTIVNEAQQILPTLKALNYRPQVVLIDQDIFGEHSENLWDLLAEIKSRYSTDQMQFWIILRGSHLEDRIRAESEGVDLILTKPIDTEMMEAALTQNIIQRPDPYRVLIVDDDPDVCDFIKDALEEMGTVVESLTDGSHLLEKLQTFEPDLLLLDINLPKHSGWLLLRLLRDDFRYRQLKIILVSGRVDEEESFQHREDYDEIWLKPLDRKELQRKVKSFANKRLRVEQEKKFLPSLFLPESQYTALLDSLLLMQKKLPTLEQHFVVIGSLDYNAILQKSAQVEFLSGCELLINRLSKEQHALKGYIGGGLFGLFFSNVAQNELEHFLTQFINESEYQLKLPAQEQAFAAFSVLNVICDQNFHDAAELISLAKSNFNKSVLMPGQLAMISLKPTNSNG